MIFEQKLRVLLAYGFTVGVRDGRLNTDHPGYYMVLEGTVQDAEEAGELPTRDGANGPWCLVGDDLSAMLDEAFDHAGMFDRFAEVCADVLAGGVGLLIP